MGMAVPESMVRMTFSSTEPEYLVEFSQDELDELAHIMPAELAFKETDHSFPSRWSDTANVCLGCTKH